jgi:hypothetical protein
MICDWRSVRRVVHVHPDIRSRGNQFRGVNNSEVGRLPARFVALLNAGSSAIGELRGFLGCGLPDRSRTESSSSFGFQRFNPGLVSHDILSIRLAHVVLHIRRMGPEGKADVMRYLRNVTDGEISAAIEGMLIVNASTESFIRPPPTWSCATSGQCFKYCLGSQIAKPTL